jgi:hypothetical protein
MLPDWMDNAAAANLPGGALTEKDRASFELHIATCAECAQMLADAQRGAAMLEMLKSPRPEPSSALLERILANTSGQTSGLAGPAKGRTSGLIALPSIDGAGVEIQSVNPAHYILGADSVRPVAGASSTNVLPFRSPTPGRFSLRAVTHTMMQPRMAMTAAMAFFSIALTLNLTGVHLNDLSVSDLKPSNLRRTFYQTNASFVRYYENLRVVYELESRVQDLKRSNDSDGPEAGPEAAGPKAASGTGAAKEKSKSGQPRKDSPKAGSGTSRRDTPMRQNFRLAAAQDRDPVPGTELFESLARTRFTAPGVVAAGGQLKEQKQEGVPA